MHVKALCDGLAVNKGVPDEVFELYQGIRRRIASVSGKMKEMCRAQHMQ